MMMSRKRLGRRFEDVLRRRYCAIGKKPCQQQLSVDEIHFINGIPGVPSRGCAVHTDLQTNRRLSSSDLVDLQTWKRTQFRLACDQIWQFRLANAGAKPRQKSDDAEEAQLGRFLDKLTRREKGDLGEGTHPSQKKLSSADKEYLRNTLVEPMPTATTAATTADQLETIQGKKPTRGDNSDSGCTDLDAESADYLSRPKPDAEPIRKKKKKAGSNSRRKDKGKWVSLKCEQPQEGHQLAAH